MKFSVIALIASTTAIKLSEKGGCIDQAMGAHIFAMVDSNHNGQINKSELVTALNEFAKEKNYTPT